MLRFYRLHPNKFSFKTMQAYREALTYFERYHRPMDPNAAPGELFSPYLLRQQGNTANDDDDDETESQLDQNLEDNSSLEPGSRGTGVDATTTTSSLSRARNWIQNPERYHFTTPRKNSHHHHHDTNTSQSLKDHVTTLPHISILLAPKFSDIFPILHQYTQQNDQKKPYLDKELIYCILLRLSAHLEENARLERGENEEASSSPNSQESKDNFLNAADSAGWSFDIPTANEALENSSVIPNDGSELLRWLKFLYICHERERDDLWDLKRAGHAINKNSFKKLKSPFQSDVELQALYLTCCTTHEDFFNLLDFLYEKKEYSSLQHIWSIYVQMEKLEKLEERSFSTDPERTDHSAERTKIFEKFLSLFDELYDAQKKRIPSMRLHETTISTFLILSLQTGKDWRIILDYYEEVPPLFEAGGSNAVFLHLVRTAAQKEHYDLLEWIWPALPDSLLMSYEALRIMMECILANGDLIRFLSIFKQYETLLMENPKFFDRRKFSTERRFTELVGWMDCITESQVNELYDTITEENISSNALVTSCMVTFMRLGDWKSGKDIYSLLQSSNVPFAMSCYRYIFEHCLKQNEISFAIDYFRDMLHEDRPIQHSAVEIYMEIGQLCKNNNEQSAWMNTLLELLNDRGYIPGDTALLMLLQSSSKEKAREVLDYLVSGAKDDAVRGQLLGQVKTARQRLLQRSPITRAGQIYKNSAAAAVPPGEQ